MGTGGTVNVSSADVAHWLDGQINSLNDDGNAAMTQLLGSGLPSADSLFLAGDTFPHVAHQDDFGVTGNVSAEIAMIADAVFGNGRHPAVEVPQRDQEPVLRAMQIGTQLPMAAAADDNAMPPSTAVLAVGGACALFGDLLNDWSATVQQWMDMTQPADVSRATNRQSDLGAGYYLVGHQYCRCGPGIDTPTTGKSYVGSAFSFRLIYSHSAFLRYQQGLDAALIDKLKQDIENRRDNASAIARSATVSASGLSFGPMQSAMAQYWTDALQIMNNAEQRAQAT
jgi:hypothetical protein